MSSDMVDGRRLARKSSKLMSVTQFGDAQLEEDGLPL